jgi:hypothetical protein
MDQIINIHLEEASMFETNQLRREHSQSLSASLSEVNLIEMMVEEFYHFLFGMSDNNYCCLVEWID